MSAKELIDKAKVPSHIAIIMDGNGRWARDKGQERSFGHQSGVDSVRDVLKGIVEIGVPYITLYTFSTENWNRPKEEVHALMDILVHSIALESETMMKQGIRLNAIGDLQQLPVNAYDALMEAIKETAKNSVCTLTLALSYSARWEIVNAAKRLVALAAKGEITPKDINEELFANQLTTYNLPDPELMIRTGGEQRISNYLLWQLAYAELYFTEKHWPDFRKEDLFEAILEYQKRERRFGLTSEQIIVK
ncbi:isoprenyl transferase [Olivibacter sitiensis]|uniref:isoprenyl transferase n=1 Tax=Olivibacter sitiensis TaxID=376470 RepID=UPI000482BE3B|nr:isoprenyl transferase [Olivibacter sitiensis]